jgi:hypothetical protein
MSILEWIHATAARCAPAEPRPPSLCAQLRPKHVKPHTRPQTHETHDDIAYFTTNQQLARKPLVGRVVHGLPAQQGAMSPFFNRELKESTLRDCRGIAIPTALGLDRTKTGVGFEGALPSILIGSLMWSILETRCDLFGGRTSRRQLSCARFVPNSKQNRRKQKVTEQSTTDL